MSNPLLFSAPSAGGVSWFYPNICCVPAGHRAASGNLVQADELSEDPNPQYLSGYVNETEPSPKWPVVSLIICDLAVLAKCKLPV